VIESGGSYIIGATPQRVITQAYAGAGIHPSTGAAVVSRSLAANSIVAINAGRAVVSQKIVRRTNAQLLDDIAMRAEAKIGGTGRFAGTDKHVYAKRVLERYQRMFGQRGLSTEVRYISGRPWEPGDGLRGTIRLDVVEGDPWSPTAIHDYKFGAASLSQPRINQIRRVGGIRPHVPIREVRP